MVEAASTFWSAWSTWRSVDERARGLNQFYDFIITHKQDEAFREELRSRGAISVLGDFVTTIKRSDPTNQRALQGALALLSLAMLKLSRRSGLTSTRPGLSHEQAVLQDHQAVVSLAQTGAVGALSDISADERMPWSLRIDALHVLELAAYNGVRLPALLECAPTIAKLLCRFHDGTAHPSSLGDRLKLSAAAAAFIANLSIGIDNQTARELDGDAAVVDCVHKALCALQILCTISGLVLYVGKFVCHLCNALVHFSGALQQEILAKHIGEPLYQIVNQLDWSSERVLMAKTTVACARLAHNLIPCALRIRPDRVSADRPLELCHCFLDPEADGDSTTPWSRVFSAAWRMYLVSVKLEETPIFSVESPVHEAAVQLALILEVKLPLALGVDGDESQTFALPVALLELRCRLWLGGVVPDGVTDERVAFWTSLCTCGFRPDFAKRFEDSDGLPISTFAANTVWSAIDSAPTEADSNDEELDSETVLRRRIDAAIAKAESVLADPWLNRLKTLTTAALNAGDFRFDVGLEAFFLVNEPLSEIFCFRRTCTWVDDVRCTREGYRQVSGNVKVVFVGTGSSSGACEPTEGGCDGGGDGDGDGDGDKDSDDKGKEPASKAAGRAGPSVSEVVSWIQKHLEKARYLFHGNLAKYVEPLQTDVIGALLQRVRKVHLRSSDFVGPNQLRFYLTESLEAAVEHADRLGRQDKAYSIDLCVVAFKYDQSVFVPVANPEPLFDVSKGEGEGEWSWNESPKETAALTVWHPTMCDWEEVVWECQSPTPNFPFFGCAGASSKVKCTCKSNLPLCARGQDIPGGNAANSRRVFYTCATVLAPATGTPPVATTDAAPSAAAAAPSVADAVRTTPPVGTPTVSVSESGAAKLCVRCEKLKRCYCKKLVACHQMNPTNRSPIISLLTPTFPDAIEGPESCSGHGGQKVRHCEQNSVVHQLVLRTFKAFRLFSTLERTLFVWRCIR